MAKCFITKKKKKTRECVTNFFFNFFFNHKSFGENCSQKNRYNNIVIIRIAVALGITPQYCPNAKKGKTGPKKWPHPQAHALLRYRTPECWAMLACSGVFFSLPLCSAAAAAFSFCTARLELSLTHASQTSAPRRGTHTHTTHRKHTFLL